MKKIIKRVIVVLFAILGVYLLLLIFPNILFSYKLEYRNFQVSSDRPITKNIELVVDDAISRLKNSELYDSSYTFKVYFCNDNWRFSLFTRNRNAGGVVNFPISPNVFIRESNIETNEIIPPGGLMHTPKERPLSYFIAHECIHSLQRNKNALMQISTPSYIIEGYADYIAKEPDFEYVKYKEMYLAKDSFMNPKSGLYHKYHLYTAYLIDKKGYSFDSIISQRPDLEQTLKQASKE